MNSIKDNRKKILFLIPSLIGGGAERVFLNLINNLDYKKYNIILVVGLLHGPYLKFLSRDVIVHELGSDRASKTFFRLLILIWKTRPDIVFSTLGFIVSSAIASIFFPPKTKLIVRYGNTVGAYLQEIKEKYFIRYILQYIFNALPIFLADLVVVQSDYMRQDLFRLYWISPKMRGKLTKINNPIDVKGMLDLASSAENIVSVRSRPRFLAIGRLSWQKGYDDLINAFALVKCAIPDATLTILGEGEAKNDLQFLVSKLRLDGSVFMPGFSGNPYSSIKQSDIFVSSSRYEGFSNVILESLALGVPVVATDCPSGVRELIRNHENGWLVSIAGDLYQNLSKSMIFAAENFKSLDMSATINEITTNYRIESIALRYENIFDTIKC